jgi:hypothetical protein
MLLRGDACIKTEPSHSLLVQHVDLVNRWLNFQALPRRRRLPWWVDGLGLDSVLKRR